MRILMLGAGGIGGYFGGRLAAAGVDVTFLVRPARATRLARDGVVIKSPFGDLTTPVKTLTKDSVAPGYDLIVLACKAYDLEDVIAAIAPAVAGAMILPQLNGMRHLDRLDAAFGQGRVLGGVAQIGLARDADGTIRHINRSHGFIFGERAPQAAAFCAALAPVLAKGGFDARHSADIIQDMWEKWVFICTNAAMSCLMRATIGAVAGTDHGVELSLALHDECSAVATASGHPPRGAHTEQMRRNLASREGTVEPSMLRDLRAGFRVEADHIVGDMLARALAVGQPATLLKVAFTHLQVYEAQRQEAARR